MCEWRRRATKTNKLHRHFILLPFLLFTNILNMLIKLMLVNLHVCRGKICRYVYEISTYWTEFFGIQNMNVCFHVLPAYLRAHTRSFRCASHKSSSHIFDAYKFSVHPISSVITVKRQANAGITTIIKETFTNTQRDAYFQTCKSRINSRIILLLA